MDLVIVSSSTITGIDNPKLRSMGRKKREAHEDSFFGLYRKTSNVKRSAELADVPLKTATTWVRSYKDNGNKIKKEGKRDPESGRDGILSDGQLKLLVAIIVDKDPCQYKPRFALWKARTIKLLIEREFHVEIAGRTVRLYMKPLSHRSVKNPNMHIFVFRKL